MTEKLVRLVLLVTIAGVGLSACSGNGGLTDLPLAEHEEPEPMREGPGLLSGDHGTIIHRY